MEMTFIFIHYTSLLDTLFWLVSDVAMDAVLTIDSGGLNLIILIHQEKNYLTTSADWWCHVAKTVNFLLFHRQKPWKIMKNYY